MERAWAQMSLLSFETLLWVKASSEYPEKKLDPRKARGLSPPWFQQDFYPRVI